MSESAGGWALDVQIVGWAGCDPQPGVVTCRFADRWGKLWSVVTKYYNVTDSELNEASEYPVAGHLTCRVTRRGVDDIGRRFAEIYMDAPVHELTSNQQVDVLEVFEDQLLKTCAP